MVAGPVMRSSRLEECHLSSAVVKYFRSDAARLGDGYKRSRDGRGVVT